MTYTASGWQAMPKNVDSIRTVTEAVATAGQTIVPAPYLVGSEIVVVNGITISPQDYNATTGTNIVFNDPLEADDEVLVMAFKVNSNGYTKQQVDYLLSRVIGTQPAIGDLDMTDHNIVNVLDPRNGVTGENDAVNRKYVDKIENKLYTTTTDAVEAQITVGGAADKFDAVKMLGATLRGADLIDGDTIVVEKTTTVANDKHQGIYFYDKDTDKWYFAGTGTGDSIPVAKLNLREDHTDPVPQGDLPADVDIVAEAGHNSINVFNGNNGQRY